MAVAQDCCRAQLRPLNGRPLGEDRTAATQDRGRTVDQCGPLGEDRSVTAQGRGRRRSRPRCDRKGEEDIVILPFDGTALDRGRSQSGANLGRGLDLQPDVPGHGPREREPNLSPI